MVFASLAPCMHWDRLFSEIGNRNRTISTISWVLLVLREGRMAEYIPSRWTGLRWIGGSIAVAYAGVVAGQNDVVAIAIFCLASGCLFVAGLLTLATGR